MTFATFITQHARWSIGNVMQTAKEQLAKGLNRELAPGVRLTAEVKQVQGLVRPCTTHRDSTSRAGRCQCATHHQSRANENR